MYSRLDLLKKCLILQSESGKEKIQIIPQLYELFSDIQQVYNIEFEVVEQDNGNLYITKGKTDLYPCLVAHSDDVAKYNPDKALVHIDGADWIKACDKITMEPHDTGGDDKCGIWSIMQALIDLPNFKGFISISEEVGCIGSNAADIEFFKDCMFISQFDRRGKADFIDYTNGVQVASKEFKDYVKPYMDQFGFSFANGSVTDVGALVKKGVGLCAHNLSCGYYNPHSNNSYVKISELFNSYDFWLSIVSENKTQFKLTTPPPTPVYSYSGKASLTEKDVSKRLHSLYIEETKKSKAHHTDKIVAWVVSKFAHMDDLNSWISHYDPCIDSMHDYLLELEDKKAEAANYKKLGELKACKNSSTCKEMRVSDYYAVGGAVDTCITCGKEFPLKSSLLGKQMDLHNEFGAWDA